MFRPRVTRDFIVAGRITFWAARLPFIFALRPDAFPGLTVIDFVTVEAVK
jgi:hypothetical protein